MLLLPALTQAENLGINDPTMTDDLVKLDQVMTTISSAVMGCMDQGKAHKECMCETKHLFAKFTETSNELFYKHPQLEGHDLINFKNPEGILVNLSLEGVKKQSAMEIACNK